MQLSDLAEPELTFESGDSRRAGVRYLLRPKADGTALPLTADVLDRAQLLAARDQIVAAWGGIDILINAAGGNHRPRRLSALDQVFRLNLNGSILPAFICFVVLFRSQSEKERKQKEEKYRCERPHLGTA